MRKPTALGFAKAGVPSCRTTKRENFRENCFAKSGGFFVSAALVPVNARRFLSSLECIVEWMLGNAKLSFAALLKIGNSLAWRLRRRLFHFSRQPLFALLVFGYTRRRKAISLLGVRHHSRGRLRHRRRRGLFLHGVRLPGVSIGGAHRLKQSKQRRLDRLPVPCTLGVKPPQEIDRLEEILSVESYRLQVPCNGRKLKKDASSYERLRKRRKPI